MNRKRDIIILAFVAAVMLSGGNAIADFTFGEPTDLGERINSPADEVLGCISADGLSLYFNDWTDSGYPVRPGGKGQEDIWVATRATTDDEWGEPINLGAPINAASRDGSADISVDGLMLHFCSDRSGNFDLYVATRATTDANWGEPESLETINTMYGEACPRMATDGLTLYFCDIYNFRPGGQGGTDLWVATRATTDDNWGEPENLGSIVNSSFHDFAPNISADGLSLFFGSKRSGGFGSWDLWVTTRATTNDAWGEPKNLGPPVNTSFGDDTPAVSYDGSTLYFKSRRPDGGDLDLWQAPILPVVDFNADGIVDLKDFSKLAQYWQQNERSVDIAPPIGNGIVDVRDAAVFAEYWLQGAGPFAHWRLDETDGNTAHDSAGDYDGTLYGDPVWQPTEGKVAGALQFDGTNDYVSTPFVLNPSDGPFSVFAWIKGGAPGQVVLSQAESRARGRNWLSAETLTGALLADLTTDLAPEPLTSHAVITDGNWHRVGLSWDGASLVLYVDGVEVAEKTQSDVPSSTRGLNIGAGEDLDAASFFLGLIDDVRIYDRAILP